MPPRRHEGTKTHTKRIGVALLTVFACASLAASWSLSAQERSAREAEARAPIDAWGVQARWSVAPGI